MSFFMFPSHASTAAARGAAHDAAEERRQRSLQHAAAESRLSARGLCAPVGRPTAVPFLRRGAQAVEPTRRGPPRGRKVMRNVMRKSIQCMAFGEPTITEQPSETTLLRSLEKEKLEMSFQGDRTF